MCPALSSIQDPALRDWVDKEVITAPKLEADYKALSTGMKRTLDYLVDNERNFSGSGAPVDLSNGIIWHDNTNNLLKFRRSAAWDTIATEKTAKDIDFTTGGTATHKPMGAVNVDSTQNDLGVGNTGVLASYTIPANVLGSAGIVVRVKVYGTKSGANGLMGLSSFIETTLDTATTKRSIEQHIISVNSTHWVVFFSMVMSSANNYKAVSWLKSNRDDMGRTESVASIGPFEFDTDKTVKLELTASGVDASDTAIMEGMIVELLG